MKYLRCPVCNTKHNFDEVEAAGTTDLLALADRMLGQICIIKDSILEKQEMEYIQNHLDGISLIIHKIKIGELE